MTQSKSPQFLVIGASGTVGSAVVKLLKNQGCNVRSTTSNYTVANSTNYYVNLANGDGIDQAFENIDRVFLLSPSGFANHYKILAPLISAAKKNNVEKVVLMTSIGVLADLNSPYRKAEIELENSGLNYNIIQPNWFMQNFNTFWLDGINQYNKIMLPTGSAKTSFIDINDVAEVAVKLLTADNFNNQTFSLTGAEAFDHQQIANFLTKVSNKNISYQDISEQNFKQNLLSAGLPTDYADFISLIISDVKAGKAASITNHVKNILGREPIAFNHYAQQYKECWA